MFTGIVESVGNIVKIEKAKSFDNGVRIAVNAKNLDFSEIHVGDSISVQGACMTIEALDLENNNFSIMISRESLECTAGLDCLGAVNLERSLCLSTRLGGHLLLGHIDAIGKIINLLPLGENTEMTLSIPGNIGRYIVYKGPIAVNGISLTVNKIVKISEEKVRISINVIPHTKWKTTLCYAKTGDFVNIEVDIIARYVEELLIHTQKH